MLCKVHYVLLTVFALAMYSADGALASGHTPQGSHPHAGPSSSHHTSNDHWRADWQHFHWPGSYYYRPFGRYGGWGGLLYGWGYAYPGWAYELDGIPYFSQFPPIYYGYEDNMPVVKPAIPSAWQDGAGLQPPPDSASPSRPPLRIINPYYYESGANKAEK